MYVLEEARARSGLSEDLGDNPAHRRPACPVGVLFQFGRGDAHPLDQETGDNDGQHQPQQDSVVPETRQTQLGRPHHIAANEGHDQPNRGQHAEDVERERVA